MKKFLKSVLLVTALSNLLMAETVFNLGAQQFYNSITPAKHFQDATYDLDTSIASTGLAFVDGRYEPKPTKSGGLSVQVKDPKPHWGVSFSMYCFLESDGCGVNLVGSNGHTINIFFEYYNYRVEGVTLNDVGFHSAETINGTIDGNGDNIQITVNGHSFSVTKTDFELANVEMNIATEGSSAEIRIDGITALSITASD